MGPIGPLVASELRELKPRLAECFDQEPQGGAGQEAASRPPGLEPPDERSPPLLVLHLELVPGQIRFVDAPLENQGAASDAVIACAQEVLRGRVIPAPMVWRPGRARVILPLVR
jgi:hypothetical protein